MENAAKLSSLVNEYNSWRRKFKKKDYLFKNLINSNFFKHQRLDFSFEDKFTDYENWKWIVEQYDAYLKETNHVEIVPKIIHQIWIGSRVPKKYDKWRQSWLKYNPEFEYNLWDEKKILDIGLINEKKFLESKNVGIKSDIARYELLYRFGGIYVDLNGQTQAYNPKTSETGYINFIPQYNDDSRIEGKIYNS